ncbi:MAG: hypothetical protein EOO90_22180 [Pedobacter sp.]|nr:MAG: hypothetical protein EOO90_22180 [Pedobacter sp.]
MKKLIFLIFICFAGSCSLPSAGTLGGWDIFVFPVSDKNMDNYLSVFYRKHQEFQVPKEKKYIEDYWEKSGYTFLKGMFFYFSTKPSRIYYVTYIDAGFGVENPEYARIALRAVYKEEDDKWHIKDKLVKEEQDNIKAIFEKEVILKLEEISKTKSYIQK